ncbi:MAG: SDR family NAD(P)-dependent oxidoreductase [Deltaproteobacteria bacterium]|nr:SDR family NAD(P)-dependent oxidoreductase [Deltaproteobacteria bacterium]
MREFKDKVAFITGGASGIGLGMAKVFVAAGMKVIIADIRRDHLEDALTSFDGDATNIHSIQLDVTDRNAFETAAQEAERVFGRVHVLCNNAGIYLYGPMQKATFDDWDWVLNVNLGGVINGIQTFVPGMISHGEGGHIVNTSSISGIFVAGGTGVYTTSKFAVVGLSEALRLDLEPENIGVSVLCPGFVNSKIYDCGETRPNELADSGYRVRPEILERLKAIHDEIGMDPMEVGEKVLSAIQQNKLYIFTHPEFAEEIRRRSEALLAAVPKEAADPRRVAMEDSRPKLKY